MAMGKLETDETSSESLKYWDYVKEEATTEFLIIELSKTYNSGLQHTENDYFEIWRGFTISPDNILVL